MAATMAPASTVVGLGTSTLSSPKINLSSGFLKSPVSARNPLRLAQASGGRFTCFQRDWLRKDLSVIGFGLIGWIAPSSIPAINGNSLTGLFFQSIGAELSHFPTPPALTSQFCSKINAAKAKALLLSLLIILATPRVQTCYPRCAVKLFRSAGQIFAKMSASSEHAVKRDPAVVILEEDLHENGVQLQFEPGTVIAAQPITVVRPDGVAVPVSVSRSRRRDPEEMSKRPTWLPDDWTFKLATRKTGATAGLIDPYYWDPSGEKFRSKREVLYYLKTGKRIEKKTKPQATTEASGRPSRKKKRNSSAQSTKPEA